MASLLIKSADCVSVDMRLQTLNKNNRNKIRCLAKQFV